MYEHMIVHNDKRSSATTHLTGYAEFAFLQPRVIDNGYTGHYFFNTNGLKHCLNTLTARDAESMDLIQEQEETDAEALWQDTIGLLAQRNFPDSFLAMLENCTPTSMNDGVLHAETSLQFVQKKVTKNRESVEECLSEAAFEPMVLDLSLVQSENTGSTRAPSSMSSEEARQLKEKISPAVSPAKEVKRQDPVTAVNNTEPRRPNPLVEDISETSSKLTFERFVLGDENELAYTAALQVANNNDTQHFNPLFIYGNSGLGKTHLLRAIQNYIATNDPSRVCVYRDATTFISDYTDAMRNPERSAAQELRHNYSDIDVLIIDDVQRMAGKTGTINFFFDTFNELITNGKQIVLAADRTPAQLGMGKDAFDERVTSRLGSGFVAPIQVPSYELKVVLIETFCQRLKDDAQTENVPNLTGEIPSDIQHYMAELSGSNIRVLEGFCQRCLYTATRDEEKGRTITREEVHQIAQECWPANSRTITIETVQRVVEQYYGVSHEDLVGSKRHKNLAEARHVAIWLSRKLCDMTLAEIGKHFGGRSHATVMHSISVVEDMRREDKVFYDKLNRIENDITGRS